MSKMALLIGLFSFSLFFTGGAKADDSDLGFLPPFPNLDLGDPDRDPSWAQKRRARFIAKKELESQSAQSATKRQPSISFKDRRQLASRNNEARSGGRVARVDVTNSISSHDNAYTASGNRITPFGAENDYWAGMPEATPEEILVDLPPMPDLRDPDQVTGKERIRNRMVSKQNARHAQAVAKREEAERQRTATVSRRQTSDPSSALVTVESQGVNNPVYAGNEEIPETLNREELKPFNSGSVFYKNNRKVYQGASSSSRFKFPWSR